VISCFVLLQDRLLRPFLGVLAAAVSWFGASPEVCSCVTLRAICANGSTPSLHRQARTAPEQPSI